MYSLQCLILSFAVHLWKVKHLMYKRKSITDNTIATELSFKEGNYDIKIQLNNHLHIIIFESKFIAAL